MRKMLIVGTTLVLSGPVSGQIAARAADNAGQKSDAQTTTATFGDWQVRCQQVGTPPQTRKSCEAIQTFTVKGQSAPFAQIAFGKPAPNEQLHVTVVVPHNVSFPSSVRVATDDKGAHPVELAWSRCLAPGCFATAAVKDDDLKLWRGLSQTGQVAFKSGVGQEVVLPLSFRGLGPALDALAKEH